MNNLTQFHSENKLRDASILFIITQLLSATDLKFAKSIFLELDENGDGKLSKQELINGYKKYFSEENTEALVNSIMKEVDTDDNGFIDYNEFLKATVDINKILSNENLQNTFKLFDKDGNGKISMQELKFVLQNGGEDERIWVDIISQTDLNGDGEIDFAEFTAILRNIKRS